MKLTRPQQGAVISADNNGYFRADPRVIRALQSIKVASTIRQIPRTNGWLAKLTAAGMKLRSQLREQNSCGMECLQEQGRLRSDGGIDPEPRRQAKRRRRSR
jgi:hypothetical protein